MRLEHVAINVQDPAKVAEWYVAHFEMIIKFRLDEKPFTHFLSDSMEMSLIEIYNNPPDQVPDYASMDPLLLHLAFASEDPDYDRDRLLKAGATFESNVHLEDGSHLIMMRDPWGLAIQLCQRALPMI